MSRHASPSLSSFRWFSMFPGGNPLSGLSFYLATKCSAITFLLFWFGARFFVQHRGMFIRRTQTRNRVSGEPYVTYRVVHSTRAGKAIKQTTLLNLGSHFDLAQEHWPALARRVDESPRAPPAARPVKRAKSIANNRSIWTRWNRSTRAAWAWSTRRCRRFANAPCRTSSQSWA